MKKVKVLFVCLGNICRSPLAEAILKHKIREHDMASWVEVDSCGTSNYNLGDSADPRTLASASGNGIFLEHQARQLLNEDLEKFDFIFAMDKSNFQNIRKLSNARDFHHKIKMMRDFDPQGKGDEVPDPYHGGEKDFREVYEMLDRSIGNFIAFLQKETPVQQG